tara:strand:- start:1295 stop:1624 length:330 start_codon:yes stop_codon:yes gene_type:complete
MPKMDEFRDHNAATDKFVSFRFGDDTMWSLQFMLDSGGSEGTAKYTIMCSNVSADISDMRNLNDSKSTDVTIDHPIFSKSFPFTYIGIQYTAGTATGVLNVWKTQKLDR